MSDNNFDQCVELLTPILLHEARKTKSLDTLLTSLTHNPDDLIDCKWFHRVTGDYPQPTATPKHITVQEARTALVHSMSLAGRKFREQLAQNYEPHSETEFTLYDTVYNLANPEDCAELMVAIETFGKVHSWKLYDLICQIEQAEGNADDYDFFLAAIAERFAAYIDFDAELVTDDCVAKTILSQFSPRLHNWFAKPESAQAALMTPEHHIYSDTEGLADPYDFIPVQMVRVH